MAKGSVKLLLDARCTGVRVPSALSQEPELALNVSPRSPPYDLQLTKNVVRQTLSFSKTRFTVVVPWYAISGIVPEGQEARVFEEDRRAVTPTRRRPHGTSVSLSTPS